MVKKDKINEIRERYNQQIEKQIIKQPKIIIKKEIAKPKINKKKIKEFSKEEVNKYYRDWYKDHPEAQVKKQAKYKKKYREDLEYRKRQLMKSHRRIKALSELSKKYPKEYKEILKRLREEDEKIKERRLL